jgi:hypothetical protein
MFAWIQKTWGKFHNWCAKIAPGVKTFLITACGALGSVGALAQQYITGIPLEKFATMEQILIVNVVLFTLAFWGRALANRAS